LLQCCGRQQLQDILQQKRCNALAVFGEACDAAFVSYDVAAAIDSAVCAASALPMPHIQV
jgi:hypothetical protein